jgi:hypothetical protein
MPRTKGFAWTEEADAELRRLLPKRHTASMIAGELSTAFAVHLSRCAILGRAHRKGFIKPEISVAPLKSNASAAPKVKRRIGIQPTIRERISFPVAAPKPFIDDLAPTRRFMKRSSFQCAWIPSKSDHNAMCCGRPVVAGYSWCAFHCGAAFATPAEIRRRSIEEHKARIAERAVA